MPRRLMLPRTLRVVFGVGVALLGLVVIYVLVATQLVSTSGVGPQRRVGLLGWMSVTQGVASLHPLRAVATLLLAGGVIYATVRLLTRVPPRPGCCECCGYDLRGSPTGRACSECGGVQTDRGGEAGAHHVCRRSD